MRTSMDRPTPLQVILIELYCAYNKPRLFSLSLSLSSLGFFSVVLLFMPFSSRP